MSRIVKCLLCSLDIVVKSPPDIVIRLSNRRRLHQGCLRALEDRIRDPLKTIEYWDLKIRELESVLHRAQRRRWELEEVATPGVFKRLASWLSGDGGTDRLLRETARQELLKLQASETPRSAELADARSCKRAEEMKIVTERITLEHIYKYWPGDPPDWETRKMEALRRGRRCQWTQLRNSDSLRKANCFGPLHVHHMRPVIEGGSHAPENLILLCQRHHEMHHGYRIATTDGTGSRFYTEDRIRVTATSDKETELEKAARQGATVQIEYTSQLGVQTVRDITPKEIFRGRFGRRYVRAYCHLRKADRIFRIARIKSTG